MDRQVRKYTLISIIFLIQLIGVVGFTVSYNKREDYLKAPQKIYKRMSSFSFVFDGHTI